jgi:hypothetical protein
VTRCVRSGHRRSWVYESLSHRPQEEHRVRALDSSSTSTQSPQRHRKLRVGPESGFDGLGDAGAIASSLAASALNQSLRDSGVGMTRSSIGMGVGIDDTDSQGRRDGDTPAGLLPDGCDCPDLNRGLGNRLDRDGGRSFRGEPRRGVTSASLSRLGGLMNRQRLRLSGRMDWSI